jgi:hypothetical protein
MSDYKHTDLVEWLLELDGGFHFEGGARIEDIERVEAALSVTFPPSYRAFLLHLGSGGLAGAEVCGILRGDPLRQAGDLVWSATADAREVGLADRFVVIQQLSDRGYYCLDLERQAEGECAVVLVEATPERAVSVEAPSFAHWFETYLRTHLELALEERGEVG